MFLNASGFDTCMIFYVMMKETKQGGKIDFQWMHYSHTVTLNKQGKQQTNTDNHSNSNVYHTDIHSNRLCAKFYNTYIEIHMFESPKMLLVYNL